MKGLICTGLPDKTGFIGGIANIIHQYFAEKAVFHENGIEYDFLNFYDADPKIKQKHLHEFLRAKKNAERINAYLTQNPVQFVHIHSSRSFILLKDLYIIHKLKKHHGVKVLLSIHFAGIDNILPKQKALRSYCIKRLQQDVDELILLSKQTKKEFETICGLKGKCSLLYTFHNLNLPAARLEQKLTAMQQKESADLLFVGSIDRRKGILDLLKACQQLKGNFTLHICGKIMDEGIRQEYTALVQALGGKAVEHGYVSGTQKEELFLQADALVLPSYAEGMPVVIMEAMASGQALAVTPVGAVPELIHDQENGLFLRPGDVESIKDALQKLLDDRAFRIRAAKTNLEYSKAYTVEENIKQLCQIYHHTVK